MEGENTFASDAANKKFISRICKQLIQLDVEKQPSQKVGRRPEQKFLQRRHSGGYWLLVSRV